MNGQNGSKLAARRREMLDNGDALGVEALDAAWSANDYEQLVRMGALSRGDVQADRGTLLCANPKCLRQIGPRDSVSFADPSTGEAYCKYCPPGRIRLVRSPA